jgi:hypothetical protein
MKQLIICLFFLAAASGGLAQDPYTLSTTDKKAQKFFFEAVDQYSARNYREALVLLDKALKSDPSFIEAWVLVGDIGADQGKLPEALDAYQQGLSINPDYSPRLWYIIGNVQLLLGKYAAAQASYLKYLSFDRIPEKARWVTAQSLRNCEFGMYAMDHPVPFNPVNLGDSINTQYSEYVNTITTDGSMLFFTRSIPSAELNSGFQEEFFFSRRKDTVWGKAVNLGPPINTQGNEGGLFISPDGRFLFFAACDRADGMGSCDLYWSRKEGGSWGVPQNLGPVVNSGTWGFPALFLRRRQNPLFRKQTAGRDGQLGYLEDDPAG